MRAEERTEPIHEDEPFVSLRLTRRAVDLARIYVASERRRLGVRIERESRQGVWIAGPMSAVWLLYREFEALRDEAAEKKAAGEQVTCASALDAIKTALDRAEEGA